MVSILSVSKKTFFYPFSLLWEWVYIIRRNLYKYGLLSRYYFKVPIISVGNVTFGGTGKTPFTIWLTETFNEYKKSCVVLTRGYKGNLEHSSGIIIGDEAFKNDPQIYGDEPLLIARRLIQGAVIVGKKRGPNLLHYFHRLKPDVVLLDDGFQHLKLFQDFSIVLFDALLPIEQYKVAPLGYLREGMTALSDADAIVLSRADQVGPEKLAELKAFINHYVRPGIPWGEIKYAPTGIYNSHFNKVYDMKELNGRKVIAVAAIASPDSFFSLLSANGAEVVEKVVFPDHYYFTPNDVNELLVSAASEGALLITSEKDMVKIRRISLDARILFVDIKVHFISGENELREKIRNILY
ncbi:MAG: tetraacyldisaccharide 4'-kinase [Bacteriovoracaceae bacterium]